MTEPYSERAGMIVSRMWQQIARLLQKQAIESATNGYSDRAIQHAKYAEAAYWQATGSMDLISFKELSK